LLEEWPSAFPQPEPYTADTSANEGKPRSGGLQEGRARQYDPQPGSGNAISLIDPTQAVGETALFIRASEALVGGCTNATLLWAHIPYIAKLWPPYQIVMEREGLGGVLPSILRMYVLMRTAFLNQADYSLAHRTALARAAGVTAEQLLALSLDNCDDAGMFSDRERAMLRWVDQVRTNMAKRRPDLFDELKKHFNDVELVELTGLCAIANQVDLTLNALRVPLESADRIAAVNGSVRMDPARLKAYLASIHANWPDTFSVPNGESAH
jgi:hypothetical protein